MAISIQIHILRTDGGTQPRASLNPETVEEYAGAMKEGVQFFPAVTAFFDGNDYWLADGFHRIAAAKSIGLTAFACDVRQGARRDAVLHSVGANATHGLRRTNEDKRRAATALLVDEEWRQWSDREIARRCGVSDRFVNTLRAEMTANGLQSPDIRKGADGRAIDTSNIGHKLPRFPVNGGLWYPLDTIRRIIYNDPRYTAEEIPVPYRPALAADLLTEVRYEMYRMVDEAMPTPADPVEADWAAKLLPAMYYAWDSQKKIVYDDPSDSKAKLRRKYSTSGITFGREITLSRASSFPRRAWGDYSLAPALSDDAPTEDRPGYAENGTLIGFKPGSLYPVEREFRVVFNDPMGIGEAFAPIGTYRIDQDYEGHQVRFLYGRAINGKPRFVDWSIAEPCPRHLESIPPDVPARQQALSAAQNARYGDQNDGEGMGEDEDGVDVGTAPVTVPDEHTGNSPLDPDLYYAFDRTQLRIINDPGEFEAVHAKYGGPGMELIKGRALNKCLNSQNHFWNGVQIVSAKEAKTHRWSETIEQQALAATQAARTDGQLLTDSQHTANSGLASDAQITLDAETQTAIALMKSTIEYVSLGLALGVAQQGMLDYAKLLIPELAE